jgi:hypothetical protein
MIQLVEVKKTLHQLAMASKIPFGVYKLQAETLDIKVRSCDQILKHITDLMLVTEKIALYAKGTSAAILNKRALESKSKPQNLNGIIKPLLSLTKLEEVEPQWAQLFAEGMFTLCLCYANETAHPNHKVVVNLLTYCQESAEKMALEAKEAAEKDSSLKTQKVSLEIAHLNCLRYFCLIFETYKETAFEKYHNLKEIFNSPKLIRLFLPIFSRYCPVDVLQAALTKVKEMAASACKNPDLAEDFKVCFAMLFLDAHSKSVSHPGHADLLNSLLSFLHEEICKPSAIGLETLMDMLQRFDREMLPYSKIYIKRSLKLINAEIDYDHKRLVYDIFSKILTLSYVQDSDEKSSVLNAELSGKWDRGNEFLLEFRSNKLYNVDIPDVKSVKLRPYQLEGIAWVNFLFKYNLSGALCDDMGLGKTIQSLITVLIFSMKNKGSKSLIVCPNGLVKHWEMEAIKHYQGHSMKVAIIDKSFNGTWKQFKDINLFITSDHMIIKAAHLFEKEHFLVGVLDEAHLIKNEKSKLSKAIKTLTIQHKLALTGTPIQVLYFNPEQPIGTLVYL